MRGILLCQNQYQARITASRVMQSEIHNVKRGTSAGGVAPFGLMMVDKHYEISPTEAPVVKEIFAMAARGKSYKIIIDTLTRKGIKTQKGRKFSYSTLSTMLRNEKYCGTYLYNRNGGKKKKHRVLLENYDEVRNEDAIPPIISRTTFEKVQEVLDARVSCRPNLNTHSEYVLTGKLFCKACGCSMSGISNCGGRNKTRIRTYACPNHSSKRGNACKTKAINADYLETALKNAVADMINDHLTNADNLGTVLKSAKSTFEKELLDAKKRIQSLEDNISNLLNKATTASPALAMRYEKEAETVIGVEAEYRARQTELEALLAEIDSLAEKATSGIALFTADTLFTSNELTRELLNLYIERIEIDDVNDEITIKFR
jgi:site-specific DNA recombinase